jgi:hypothetical protein
VKERPILFSGPMVRAILGGHKTQTRRVLGHRGNLSDYDGSGYFETRDGEHVAIERLCPYGVPGDRLWVRETWTALHPADDFNEFGGIPSRNDCCDIYYKADDPLRGADRDVRGYGYKPSIHMPRWASRLLLEVESVRVERVQDISEQDAIAEGCEPWIPCGSITGTRNIIGGAMVEVKYRDAFAYLWDRKNGKRRFEWESNSWVWVVTFKVVNT